MFPVGETVWTMDDNMLLSMGYDNLQLSIKLPKNSDVNVIITYPYQANAVVGMCPKLCYTVTMLIYNY